MPDLFDSEEESNTNDTFPQGDSPDGGRLLVYLVLVVVSSCLVWALVEHV